MLIFALVFDSQEGHSVRRSHVYPQEVRSKLPVNIFNYVFSKQYLSLIENSLFK